LYSYTILSYRIGRGLLGNTKEFRDKGYHGNWRGVSFACFFLFLFFFFLCFFFVLSADSTSIVNATISLFSLDYSSFA
jgi:hypothetical protein